MKIQTFRPVRKWILLLLALFLSTLNPPASVRRRPDYGRGRQLSRLCRSLLVTRHWSLATICVLLISAATLFAQGSLAPPGAPAPTMKTLGQIEARIPISSAPFTITQPGSYYLTTNLNVTGGNAITINANQVTLDLNGFTVSSTAPSATGSGIQLASNPADITILNGHIKGGVTNNGGVFSGPGFANGINYSNGLLTNVRVAGVSVSGCLNYGIYLNTSNSTVESCTVQTVGNYGIVAGSISHSTANGCGNDAIFADNAANCDGFSSSSNGVHATSAENCRGASSSFIGLEASAANNCYGSSVSSYGISALTANNCVGTSSSGGGLRADSANNCKGEANGVNAGLLAKSANNCFGINTSNGTGLDVSSVATSCYGQSNSGIGLHSLVIAIGCHGYSVGAGIGLSAFTADICRGTNGGGVSESVTHPHNMP